MRRLTDTTGARIGYATADLSDGEQVTFAIKVLPNTGFELLAVPSDADVTIEARNGAEAFVDIVASPISLDAFTADSPRAYDIRITAADPLANMRRVPVWICVSRSIGIAFDA